MEMDRIQSPSDVDTKNGLSMKAFYQTHWKRTEFGHFWTFSEVQPNTL